MATLRMLGPTDARYQTVVAYGRSYTGTAGSVQDVFEPDARILGANGWSIVARSGTTAQRPIATDPIGAAPGPGISCYDTTLSKVIVFDGANWRDPVNGNAV